MYQQQLANETYTNYRTLKSTYFPKYSIFHCHKKNLASENNSTSDLVH